jgi:hypothetical protein
MTPVFADTVYYLALTNPRDQYADAASRFTSSFSGAFVTTDWVMAEVGNALSRGPDRTLFRELYRDLAQDRRVLMVPANRELFEKGIEFFADRPDKEWSLTDCISFLVMAEQKLTDALTADHHFEQAGFRVLLE